MNLPRKITKTIAFLLCFLLMFEQSGFAQIAGQLDISGRIASLRNTLTQDKFRPQHLRYLSYNTEQNNFKLLLDKGDMKEIKKSSVEDLSKNLLKYFFIGIALPNDAFWVNLRPDAPDNMIDPRLGQTDIGKILLEADLQLKKDTAQFTSPQCPEGKKYWEALYKKAEELFHSSTITIPTLTRPWIVPGEVIVRETADSAYVYKATLKVMLEQDYLKNSATYKFDDERLKELNECSSQLIREIIIPKLTKEINTSKRYAALRQVYYSLVIAQWFKQRFSGGSGTYSRLIDRGDMSNLISKESWSKDNYFLAYQKSFKEGEYNFQVPMATAYGQVVRSYFSGGIVMDAAKAINAGKVTGSETKNPAEIAGPSCVGVTYNPATDSASVERTSVKPAPPATTSPVSTPEKVAPGEKTKTAPPATAVKPSSALSIQEILQQARDMGFSEDEFAACIRWVDTRSQAAKKKVSRMSAEDIFKLLELGKLHIELERKQGYGKYQDWQAYAAFLRSSYSHTHAIQCAVDGKVDTEGFVEMVKQSAPPWVSRFVQHLRMEESAALNGTLERLYILGLALGLAGDRADMRERVREELKGLKESLGAQLEESLALVNDKYIFVDKEAVRQANRHFWDFMEAADNRGVGGFISRLMFARRFGPELDTYIRETFSFVLGRIGKYETEAINALAEKTASSGTAARFSATGAESALQELLGTYDENFLYQEVNFRLASIRGKGIIDLLDEIEFEEFRFIVGKLKAQNIALTPENFLAEFNKTQASLPKGTIRSPNSFVSRIRANLRRTFLFVFLLVAASNVNAAITADQKFMEEPLQAAGMVLTWPLATSDQDVQALSRKARELFNQDGIKVKFVVTDVKDFIAKHPELVSDEYGKTMLEKGSARAMVVTLGPNEYLVVYDSSMMREGLAGLITGLAHELIGHMSFTSEELKGLSPLEEEALIFAREIKYLEALMNDEGLMRQFGAGAENIRAELKAQLVKEKQILDWVRKNIEKEKGKPTSRGPTLSTPVLIGAGSALVIALGIATAVALRKTRQQKAAVLKKAQPPARPAKHGRKDKRGRSKNFTGPETGQVTTGDLEAFATIADKVVEQARASSLGVTTDQNGNIDIDKSFSAEIDGVQVSVDLDNTIEDFGEWYVVEDGQIAVYLNLARLNQLLSILDKPQDERRAALEPFLSQLEEDLRRVAIKHGAGSQQLLKAIANLYQTGWGLIKAPALNAAGKKAVARRIIIHEIAEALAMRRLQASVDAGKLSEEQARQEAHISALMVEAMRVPAEDEKEIRTSETIAALAPVLSFRDARQALQVGSSAAGQIDAQLEEAVRGLGRKYSDIVTSITYNGNGLWSIEYVTSEVQTVASLTDNLLGLIEQAIVSARPRILEAMKLHEAWNKEGQIAQALDQEAERCEAEGLIAKGVILYVQYDSNKKTARISFSDTKTTEAIDATPEAVREAIEKHVNRPEAPEAPLVKPADNRTLWQKFYYSVLKTEDSRKALAFAIVYPAALLTGIISGVTIFLLNGDTDFSVLGFGSGAILGALGSAIIFDNLLTKPFDLLKKPHYVIGLRKGETIVVHVSKNIRELRSDDPGVYKKIAVDVMAAVNEILEGKVRNDPRFAGVSVISVRSHLLAGRRQREGQKELPANPAFERMLQDTAIRINVRKASFTERFMMIASRNIPRGWNKRLMGELTLPIATRNERSMLRNQLQVLSERLAKPVSAGSVREVVSGQGQEVSAKARETPASTVWAKAMLAVKKAFLGNDIDTAQESRRIILDESLDDEARLRAISNLGYLSIYEEFPNMQRVFEQLIPYFEKIISEGKHDRHFIDTVINGIGKLAYEGNRNAAESLARIFLNGSVSAEYKDRAFRDLSMAMRNENRAAIREFNKIMPQAIDLVFNKDMPQYARSTVISEITYAARLGNSLAMEAMVRIINQSEDEQIKRQVFSELKDIAARGNKKAKAMANKALEKAVVPAPVVPVSVLGAQSSSVDSTGMKRLRRMLNVLRARDKSRMLTKDANDAQVMDYIIAALRSFPQGFVTRATDAFGNTIYAIDREMVRRALRTARPQESKRLKQLLTAFDLVVQTADGVEAVNYERKKGFWIIVGFIEQLSNPVNLDHEQREIILRQRGLTAANAHTLVTQNKDKDEAAVAEALAQQSQKLAKGQEVIQGELGAASPSFAMGTIEESGKLNQITDEELRDDIRSADLRNYIGDFGNYLAKNEENFNFVRKLAERDKRLAQAYLSILGCTKSAAYLESFHTFYGDILLNGNIDFAVDLMELLGNHIELLGKPDIEKLRKLHELSPQVGQWFMMAASENKEVLESEKLYALCYSLAEEDLANGVVVPQHGIFHQDYSRNGRFGAVMGWPVKNETPYGYQLAELLINIAKHQLSNAETFANNLSLLRKINPQLLMEIGRTFIRIYFKKPGETAVNAAEYLGPDHLLWGKNPVMQETVLSALGKPINLSLGRLLIDALRYYGYFSDRDSVEVITKLLSDESSSAKLSHMDKEVVDRLSGWEWIEKSGNKERRAHKIYSFLDGATLRNLLLSDMDAYLLKLLIVKSSDPSGEILFNPSAYKEYLLTLLSSDSLETINTIAQLFGRKVAEVLLGIIAQANPKEMKRHLSKEYIGNLSVNLNLLLGSKGKELLEKYPSTSALSLLSMSQESLVRELAFLKALLGDSEVASELNQGRFDNVYRLITFISRARETPATLEQIKVQMSETKPELRKEYLNVLIAMHQDFKELVLGLPIETIAVWQGNLRTLRKLADACDKLIRKNKFKDATLLKELFAALLNSGQRYLVKELEAFAQGQAVSRPDFSPSLQLFLEKFHREMNKSHTNKSNIETLKAHVMILGFVGQLLQIEENIRGPESLADTRTHILAVALWALRRSEINSDNIGNIEELASSMENSIKFGNDAEFARLKLAKERVGELWKDYPSREKVEGLFRDTLSRLLYEVTGLRNIPEVLVQDLIVLDNVLTIIKVYFKLEEYNQENMKEQLKQLLSELMNTGNVAGLRHLALDIEANKEERRKLEAAGYNPDLFDFGLEVKKEISRAKNQIRQVQGFIKEQSTVLVEIAEEMGLKLDELPQEQAEAIKRGFATYKEAAAFVELVQQHFPNHEKLERLGQILEGIKDAEKKATEGGAFEKEKIRVIISKSPLDEASVGGMAGAGCYTAGDMHQEMPVAIAFRVNRFFARAYDATGKLIGAVELSLTDNGVLVYSGQYTSRPELGLDEVWFEAWQALAQWSPAVILVRPSAGWSEAAQSPSSVRITPENPFHGVNRQKALGSIYEDIKGADTARDKTTGDLSCEVKEGLIIRKSNFSGVGVKRAAVKEGLGEPEAQPIKAEDESARPNAAVDWGLFRNKITAENLYKYLPLIKTLGKLSVQQLAALTPEQLAKIIQEQALKIKSAQPEELLRICEILRELYQGKAPPAPDSGYRIEILQTDSTDAGQLDALALELQELQRTEYTNPADIWDTGLMKSLLHNRTHVNILIRDNQGNLVGYLIAVPFIEAQQHDSGLEDTDLTGLKDKAFYVEDILFGQRHRNSGVLLLPRVLIKFRQELRRRGITSLFVHARINNGLSQALQDMGATRLGLPTSFSGIAGESTQYLRFELQKPSAPAANQGLGAQSSSVDSVGMQRLRRLLNVFRLAGQANATDAQLMKHVISQLQDLETQLGTRLIARSTYLGNLVYAIDRAKSRQALSQAPPEARKRLKQLLSAFDLIVQTADGVEAINYQAPDGTWTIVGFSEQLNNPANLDHEQREIILRQRGLTAANAHTLVAQNKDKDEAALTEALAQQSQKPASGVAAAGTASSASIVSQPAVVAQMVLDALNAGQIRYPLRPASSDILRTPGSDTVTITVGGKKIDITINELLLNYSKPNELVHRGAAAQPFVFINFQALNSLIRDSGVNNEVVVKAVIDRLVLHETAEMFAVVSGYSDEDAHAAGEAAEGSLMKDLPLEISAEVEKVLQPVLKEREQEKAKQAQSEIVPAPAIVSAANAQLGATQGEKTDVVGYREGQITRIQELMKKEINELEGSPELKQTLLTAIDKFLAISRGEVKDFDQAAIVKWHDYMHVANNTYRMILAMRNLQKDMPQIPADAILLAAVAGMYHDVGYYAMDKYDFKTIKVDHEIRSMEYVRDKAAELGINPQYIGLVRLVIAATQSKVESKDWNTLEEALKNKDLNAFAAILEKSMFMDSRDVHEIALAAIDNPDLILGMIYAAKFLLILDVRDTRPDALVRMNDLREEFLRDYRLLLFALGIIPVASAADISDAQIKEFLARVKDIRDRAPEGRKEAVVQDVILQMAKSSRSEQEKRKAIEELLRIFVSFDHLEAIAKTADFYEFYVDNVRAKPFEDLWERYVDKRTQSDFNLDKDLIKQMRVLYPRLSDADKASGQTLGRVQIEALIRKYTAPVVAQETGSQPQQLEPVRSFYSGLEMDKGIINLLLRARQGQTLNEDELRRKKVWDEERSLIWESRYSNEHYVLNRTVSKNKDAVNIEVVGAKDCKAHWVIKGNTIFAKAFEISPEHQSKGFGRQMMHMIADYILTHPEITHMSIAITWKEDKRKEERQPIKILYNTLPLSEATKKTPGLTVTRMVSNIMFAFNPEAGGMQPSQALYGQLLKEAGFTKGLHLEIIRDADGKGAGVLFSADKDVGSAPAAVQPGKYFGSGVPAQPDQVSKPKLDEAGIVLDEFQRNPEYFGVNSEEILSRSYSLAGYQISVQVDNTIDTLAEISGDGSIVKINMQRLHQVLRDLGINPQINIFRAVLFHELAEAIARQIVESDPHAEGMVAEALFVQDKPELRDQLAKLWAHRDAQEGGAWGKTGKGYDGNEAGGIRRDDFIFDAIGFWQMWNQSGRYDAMTLDGARRMLESRGYRVAMGTKEQLDAAVQEKIWPMIPREKRFTVGDVIGLLVENVRQHAGNDGIWAVAIDPAQNKLYVAVMDKGEHPLPRFGAGVFKQRPGSEGKGVALVRVFSKVDELAFFTPQGNQVVKGSATGERFEELRGKGTLVFATINLAQTPEDAAREAEAAQLKEIELLIDSNKGVVEDIVFDIIKKQYVIEFSDGSEAYADTIAEIPEAIRKKTTAASGAPAAPIYSKEFTDYMKKTASEVTPTTFERARLENDGKLSEHSLAFLAFVINQYFGDTLPNDSYPYMVLSYNALEQDRITEETQEKLEQILQDIMRQANIMRQACAYDAAKGDAEAEAALKQFLRQEEALLGLFDNGQKQVRLIMTQGQALLDALSYMKDRTEKVFAEFKTRYAALQSPSDQNKQGPAPNAGAQRPGGIDGSTGSPLTPPASNATGGVDFRGLPIVTQQIPGPARPIAAGSLRPVANLKLDKEWEEIQGMINAGIVPSCERMKEYARASCASGDYSDRMTRILSCIADILRMEEERCCITEPVLRQFLMLLDSDRSAKDLESAFAKIQVAPKEPVLTITD